jgi:DNA primase
LRHLQKSLPIRVIPKDYIAELKNHTTLLRWVTTPLTRSPDKTGLLTQSPFSSHKNSLWINLKKQTYKCLSTGATGDVFDFVMRCKNVSFIESVRLVAKESFFPAPPQSTGFTIKPIWNKLNPLMSNPYDNEKQEETPCAF